MRTQIFALFFIQLGRFVILVLRIKGSVCRCIIVLYWLRIANAEVCSSQICDFFFVVLKSIGLLLLVILLKNRNKRISYKRQIFCNFNWKLALFPSEKCVARNSLAKSLFFWLSLVIAFSKKSFLFFLELKLVSFIIN